MPWLRRALPFFLLGGIFLAAWLPRVYALDAFVTPDEPKWLTRSANFYQALTEGNLAGTYQREHPGVTIMWAGALGWATYFPDYPQHTPGPFDPDSTVLEQWLRDNSEQQALAMLVAGRWWVVLAISLTFPLAFLLLRRLFNPHFALPMVLWAAWDPFHIALSRLLHPDGLVSSLMFLSLLGLLVWQEEKQTRWLLLLSSVTLGLAALSKMSALALAPIGVLLVLGATWLREGRSWAALRPTLGALVIWGIGALVTFVVLWPAMWVNPVGTLREMATVMGYYAETGHGDGLYFLGEISRSPGPLFYPLHLLFRTTPPTLVGLGLAAFVAWRHKAALPAARTIGTLALFALLYTLVISLSAKQTERYLLPAFLPLDLIAAWGFVAGASHFAPGREARRATFALFLHGLWFLLYAPSYLTFYNPLLGGPQQAALQLSVGWGEGLEEAAAWLNEQPDAGNLRVQSWYNNGPLSYYFDGQTSPISESWSPYAWCETDFVVSYVNQWQRHLPNEKSHEYFTSLVPTHTISRRQMELVRLYDMRDRALPDFPERDERSADFGGLIRLATYEIEQQHADPGDRFRFTLTLQSLAPMERDYNILVRLVAPDGSEVWREEGWPWGAPTSNWPRCELRPDGHEVTIPPDAAPGLYALTVSFYDPATFEALPVTEANRSAPTGQTERAIALLTVGNAPNVPRPLDPAPRFGEVALLHAATLPARATPGEPLPIQLTWESLARTHTDYTVFLHLVAADGTLVAQQDSAPAGGFAATSLWETGQRIPDTHEIALPADLPPGAYTLRLGLYAADGNRLPVTLPTQPPTDAVELGTVTIE